MLNAIGLIRFNRNFRLQTSVETPFLSNHILTMTNLFTDLPSDLSAELFEDLLTVGDVRIERIVSNGQATPESKWYDQDWDEWVLVLRGEAELAFWDGNRVLLREGEHRLIPKREKHRVTMTAKPTIWLAIHIGEKAACG